MKADRSHLGYDCNECGNTNCNGDVIRTRKKIIPIACPGKVQLGPMRVSLLEAATAYPGSLTALGQVMKDLGMRMETIPKYPGFRFIMNRR